MSILDLFRRQADTEHTIIRTDELTARALRLKQLETAWSALREENVKLRELIRHMHTCMEQYDCAGCYSCDTCPYDNSYGNCDFKRRMRELGVMDA